jgi:SAM-dependent methyltransferase
MPMSKLEFNKAGTLIINKYPVFYAENFSNEASGSIKRIPFISAFPKSIRSLIEATLYEIISWRNYLLVDGFIEIEIKKLISKYLKNTDSFLEIGCGDMSVSNYLPKNYCYNAIDISLHEYFISKTFKKHPSSNICLASAHKIPLADESVSFLVISEVLYEIPDIELAMQEIARIMKKDGIAIISISNSYCYKYKKKGNHPKLQNFWSFESFIKFITNYNFRFIEGSQRGWWIPFPTWLTLTSYQLPISSKNEAKNTNFFYVFKKN